jgi:hypothetical protein
MFPVLPDERNKTRETIARLGIPKGTVSSLAGLANSEISEYLHGHTVSSTNCRKIEQAVVDITDLIETMLTHFSLRPDLKDVQSLRAAITELKSARAYNLAQSQLMQAEREVATALKEMAGLS